MGIPLAYMNLLERLSGAWPRVGVKDGDVGLAFGVCAFCFFPTAPPSA